MAGMESTYKHAWELFNKAKDYDNMTAKESYLKQAWGAANLAAKHGYPGAKDLLNQIESYASALKISVG